MLLSVAAPHAQRVILLGIYTGARIGPSELFSLTWEDIDLAHGVISMPNANKGGKLQKRDIPIRRDLIPILVRWQRQDAGCSYVINGAGKPVRKIAAAWKTARRKSGIRAIRPYDLRHAYATYSIRSGTALKTSAEIMGHENAKMILEVYEHVDWSQKVRAIENMPDFFALAPKTVRKLPYERHTGKCKIDKPRTQKCVGDTVPPLDDGKYTVNPEIKKQYNYPANEYAQHDGDTKPENPHRLECYGQIKSRDKHTLSQKAEEEDLKNKIQKPHPLVPKAEYHTEKERDRTHVRKNSTHNPLHEGAPQRDAPS